MQDFFKKNGFSAISLTLNVPPFPLFPRGFHLLPMDAQWMLKGCSMVASATMNTLSKLLSLTFYLFLFTSYFLPFTFYLLLFTSYFLPLTFYLLFLTSYLVMSLCWKLASFLFPYYRSLIHDTFHLSSNQFFVV